MIEDWLAARVRARPHHTALCWQTDDTTHTLNFAQLNTRVTGCCEKLSAEGIAAGDKVAVLLPNGTGFVTMLFALMRLNAVIVPLNIRLTPDELVYQINLTDCKFIVHDETTAILAQQIPQNDILSLYSFSEDSSPDADYTASQSQFCVGTYNLEDDFAIVFTSGTSGQPKGAVLTYANIFYSAMASAYRIGTLPDDVWLSVLPMYHVGGISILIRAVLYGITVTLRPKFDVAQFHDDLCKGEGTLVSLVPTMLHRLIQYRLQDGRAWSEQLRLILLGGAAASPELMQQCHDLHIPVATTYGLSEAASQVATTLAGDAIQKPGSVGKPLLFSSVQILDDDDRNLPPGDYGEIVVRGKTILREYYKNPEATAKTLRDGALYTGDIGYLDDEGDLWLVQRRSDLIISGGENIYPAEIEAILRQHPAIDSVAVVGIPDTEWGQRVAATIVLNTETTEDVIIAFCRDHLAGYKQPRRIKFVEALPMTASGKIQRPAVQALFDDK
ncbi:MAG: o-succinylbenzoate--CoA ligase [Aggregatilineales bacterium]